jgi:hypothetical protein
MNPIVKNVLAVISGVVISGVVISGVVVGSIVNMLMVGPILVPLPEEADVSTA